MGETCSAHRVDNKCVHNFSWEGERKSQSCPCVLTEHHTMKAHREDGVIAPLIL
jgi:hypothetical protein